MSNLLTKYQPPEARYQCLDCGARFMSPSRSDASDVVLGSDGQQRWRAIIVNVCPHCMSDEIRTL